MIAVPITYSTADLNIILTNPPSRNKDWDKPVYKKVKKSIKNYYCQIQTKKCAYCNLELEQGCHSEHIEHIVDKTYKPEWMFEPINLTLSCSQCNGKKLNKNVLASTVVAPLIVPVTSKAYIIVHPHFDDWDKHIEIVDDYFTIAKDIYKGQNTVEICGLWRPLYVDRRAKYKAISLKDRIFIAMYRIEENGISTFEKKAFMDYVDELIGYL